MPASCGVQGPGEMTNVRRVQRFDLVGRELVVAAHHDLRAQLAHVLDEVVGERVVVVEDEDHRCTYGSATALSGKLAASACSRRR